MKNVFRKSLAGFAISTFAFLALPALAGTQLLVPYSGPVPKSSTVPEGLSKGTRVTFNLEALRALKHGDEVDLALPDGKTHTLVFDLLEERGQGIVSWIGYYKGSVDKLRVVITTGPGGSYGSIATPDGEYRLMPGQGFDWLVDMVAEEPNLPKVDLHDDTKRIPPRPKSSVAPENAPEFMEAVAGVNSVAVPKATPPIAVVDIMIVYTNGLSTALGANLLTRINQLISSANTMYADSEVGIRLRLVHTTMVTYSDALDSSDTLDAITYGTGVFSNIEALRNQYGADMVALLRNGSGMGGSGIAWIADAPMSAGYAPYMYSVTTGCTAGCDWVFVHELGHNMGNSHDRATTAWQNAGAQLPGSYPYSFGYYTCSAGPTALTCDAFGGACGAQPECTTSSGTNNFADIMAYFHGSTLRNMKFSNPEITCAGQLGIATACGIHDGQPRSANAALSMNNNRTALSALFATKVTANASSTTVVTSSANPSVNGVAVTFTARVSGTSGVATGTVNFRSNGISIAGCGTRALAAGEATCTTSALATGTLSITGVYSGDATYAASTSAALTQTVAPPLAAPTVSVSSSANPATYPNAVSFTATLGGSVGVPTGTVTFRNHNVNIAGCEGIAIVTGSAPCAAGSLGVGPSSITAHYSGNSVYSPRVSAALAQNVYGFATIAMAASANPTNAGTPMSFTATVTASTRTPTGTVQFLANGGVLPGCNAVGIVGSVATCNITLTTIGTHTISGQYTGDAFFHPGAASMAETVVAGSVPAMAGEARRRPDFNADSRSDLAWKGPAGGFGLWLMNGIAAPTSTTVSGGTGAVLRATGDYDGNGRADLLWRGSDGSYRIDLMNGLTVASSATILSGGSGWDVVAKGDFNGDGRADLLWRDGTASYGIWLMNGTVATSSGLPATPGAGWDVAFVADFDGDGKSDLLWRHADGRVMISIMNGVAVASNSPVLLPAGSGWSPVFVGDFNGDGRADVVNRHPDGSHGMWLMNGTSVATPALVLGAGTGWFVKLVADVSGDGRTDLIWAHADGSVGVWIMNGVGAASTGVLLGAASGWSPVEAGDFNADGRYDLVWRHTAGAYGTWLMNGLTVSATAQILGPGTGWDVIP